MRGAKNALNYWRHLMANKTLVVALFAVIVAVVSAVTIVNQQTAAQAAACRANDIIKCGVSSGADLKTKVNQNAPGDLPAIMGHYGVNVDTMASSAVEGTAYKDGTIKVGGKVVATDAWSVGRNQQSYSKPVNIGGKTYHESSNKQVFQSDGLAVLVYMENGVFKYGVLKDCGNPTWGTPPKPPEPPKEPVYQCVDLRSIRLKEDEKASTERVYKFELEFKADNGASLKEVTFNFGNGETQTVPGANGTISSRAVTYNKAGSYTITTTLTFTVNGSTKTVTDKNCEAEIQVPNPKEIIVCREGKIITIPENEKRDTDLPEDSPECQPTPPTPEKPPVIPSTGPAEVISGVIGMSSLAGAGYYFRSSRRNLLDSIFKK